MLTEFNEFCWLDRHRKDNDHVGEEMDEDKVENSVSNIKMLSLSPVLLSSYIWRKNERKSFCRYIPGWLACARTCTKESGKIWFKNKTQNETKLLYIYRWQRFQQDLVTDWVTCRSSCLGKLERITETQSFPASGLHKGIRQIWFTKKTQNKKGQQTKLLHRWQCFVRAVWAS